MKPHLATCAAAWMCLALTPAWSQETAKQADKSPSRPLVTFEIAAVRALNAAPELKAAEENILAAAAGVGQARVHPNPELGIEAENIAGSGRFDGLNRGEYTFSLGQRLERGGKRRARIALAKSQREIARLNAARIRLDTILEAQRAYVDVLAAVASVVNAESRAVLADELQATVRERVRKARDPALAGKRIAVQVLEIRAERDRAKREFDLARRQLSLLWGAAATGFDVEIGDFLNLAGGRDNFGAAALESVPDVILRAAHEGRADAAVLVAKSAAKQDPTISFGVRHLPESDDVTAVAAISMPLAVFDTNRGNIDRANAERRRAAWDSAATRRRFEREIVTQLEVSRMARSEAMAFREDVLPMAKEALATAREGYNRGGFTFLEVLDAQRTLTRLQAREISALKKFHLAGASLDRLTARFLKPFPSEGTAR
jgi:cobalt-zinc-cadmium efflux system outer membrane protein